MKIALGGDNFQLLGIIVLKAKIKTVLSVLFDGATMCLTPSSASAFQMWDVPLAGHGGFRQIQMTACVGLALVGLAVLRLLLPSLYRAV